MFKWLKKHFIPHEGNDHQPHFLRNKNIRYLVAIVFMLELSVLSIPFVPVLNPTNNTFLASVLPAVLDDLTNQNRQSEHLAVLTVNPSLNKVAQLKANDMAKNSYFAHVSPEGKAPWYWFKQVGYNYVYAGENLAVDFTDSQDIAKAWMNSPTHKANILEKAYTEIGTGIATGTYQGKATIFVAQVFGKPSSLKPQTNTIQIVTSATSTPKSSELLKVKGASVEIVPIVPDSVATQTSAIETKEIVSTSSSEQIYTKAGIFDKYITSPRHVINIILDILAILVIIALLLKLFIRTDKKHPILITNGLIILVLIFGLYIANNYLVKSKLNSTSSFASFTGEEFDQNKNK
ncbi:MAG: CAP domain-containing protein [Candidatus Paceibacterota bacterium]